MEGLWKSRRRWSASSSAPWPPCPPPPCTYLQEVDDLYQRALAFFSDDAMLHVFAAQYFNIYRASHRLEQMHLSEAEVGVGPLCCTNSGTAAGVLPASTPFSASPPPPCPHPFPRKQRKNPTLDIVFIAFQRLQQLRQV